MSGRTDRALLLAYIAGAGATPTPELLLRCQEECDALTRAWVRDTPPIPLPGVDEVLTSFKDTGYRNVLLTGNSADRSEAKLDQVGLTSHFEWSHSIFGNQFADRVDMARLAAECFTALDQVPPIVLGDTVHDVAAGRAADLPVVAVATGGSGVRELEEAGASLVLASLASSETVLLGFLAAIEELPSSNVINFEQRRPGTMGSHHGLG